ncbi:hypothetical protein F1880_004514 [Penicillium rolfsii]|nr:hypothetical protein F1880_004514 [Penicillium rolfsii]
MRLYPWSTLSIVGAIASSIPRSTGHELHLPYLPSLSPEHDSDAYLALQWTVTNGSLYANNDQIFPPTISMQVHAPQYRGQSNARVGDEDLTLSYSLHARPLSSAEAGATTKIVRVRVDLMDLQGEAVTPNAVVLDLLAHPDGSQRITRIRMEPGKGHREGYDRPWHMKFWQTQMAGIINHGKEKDTKQNSSPAPPSQTQPEDSTQAHPSDAAAPTDDKEEVTQVGFILSPYWSPAAYSHRGHGHHRHPHHRDRTFMRLVRPVILPAVLGAAAGLVACLVGFVIGHLCMSLAVCLGLRKNRQQRRSSAVHLEDGISREKSALMPIPEIYVTDSDSDSDSEA